MNHIWTAHAWLETVMRSTRKVGADLLTTVMPASTGAQALLLITPLVLSACGGGSSGTEVSTPGTTDSSGFTVSYSAKEYTFSWNASAGATHYELWEDPDGAAAPQPEVQLGSVLTGTTYTHSLAPQPLHERMNASYRLRACDTNGCRPFSAAITPDPTKAIGYFKASNTGGGDGFGGAVALSSNGEVMAVGASGERSNATCADNATLGVVCNQSDDSNAGAGAVYMFAREGARWKQVAYIKASNNRTPGGAGFGTSLALSSDGRTLAVGAPGENSNARGVNGDQSNTVTTRAGAVYIFKGLAPSTGSPRYDSWQQEAYIKATNTRAANEPTGSGYGPTYRNAANFGHAVALSADGNLLAVGAPGETSGATGVNGDQDDSSVPYAGAVYTYVRSGDTSSGGGTWTTQAYLKASNTRGSTVELLSPPRFGEGLALSGDGKTLAVGAPYENSGATGINGNQQDTSVWGSGAVYVFTHHGGNWGQQAYVKAHNTGGGPQFIGDRFGGQLTLSADGNTLAVGAKGEATSGKGINNPPTERSVSFVQAGAAYVFTRSNSIWSQQAYLKAGNTGQNHFYGSSLALSADGNTLAVGASGEADIGIPGLTTIGASKIRGAAHLYQRTGATWNQRAHLSASNTRTAPHGSNFGDAITLSSDGITLAVGARYESSRSTGIQGDQTDYAPGSALNLPPTYGAVYLY